MTSEDSSQNSESIPNGDCSLSESFVSLEDIKQARARIEDTINHTPVDTSRTFAALSGAASVGLKLETFQRTGSFKIRGAYNKMAQLTHEERQAGVITSSAGNHAQGVALAGSILDIDTTIIVPEVTPAAKIEATEQYGADVIVEGDIYERSYEYAVELAEETGQVFVHPFNDTEIIAGQGTIGLELLEQYPNIDTVLVAVGGGGLISGIGTVLKSRGNDIRVIGVQPEGAAHAKPSLDRGEIIELEEVDTIAEGIADTRMLDKTFATARKVVDDVITVTDRQLSVAVTLLAERENIVVEAAGAAPLAAGISDTTTIELSNQNVGIVISGGNVNLTEHAELTQTGLYELGRYGDVRLSVTNWPEAVTVVVERINSAGASLDVIERARRKASDHPNEIPITVGIEASGPEHLNSVLNELSRLKNVSVLEQSIKL